MPTDLVIENTTIVTMNAKREVLRNASIAISGEKIAAIGESEDMRAQYPQAQLIDGRGKVVLPGADQLSHAHQHELAEGCDAGGAGGAVQGHVAGGESAHAGGHLRRCADRRRRSAAGWGRLP